jgi:hypothetical protein
LLPLNVPLTIGSIESCTVTDWKQDNTFRGWAGQQQEAATPEASAAATNLAAELAGLGLGAGRRDGGEGQHLITWRVHGAEGGEPDLDRSTSEPARADCREM